MKQNPANFQPKREKCTICSIRYENSRVKECSHKFCFPCINRWSKKNNSCPLCRVKITSIITKQKIRENSKIIKEGRLIRNVDTITNDCNQATGIQTMHFRMVFQPVLCYLPMRYFPFPFYPVQNSNIDFPILKE